MGRAPGNRDTWWGAEKDRRAAQVPPEIHASEAYIPFEPTVVAVTDEFVVVDKPAFLPATPNGKIVANTVQERMREQLGEPELVSLHRLDRLTSGLMLLSRNPHTRGAYQQLFARREVEKTYECLTVMPDDWVPGETRLITVHLLNSPGQRGVQVVAAGTPDAKAATTEVTFLGAVAAEIGDVFGATSAGQAQPGCASGMCSTVMQVGHWRLKPLTGRTHQLRATMNYLEYPILGEDTYGQASRRPPHSTFEPVLRLLATELEFKDPISGHQHNYRVPRDITQLG